MKFSGNSVVGQSDETERHNYASAELDPNAPQAQNESELTEGAQAELTLSHANTTLPATKAIATMAEPYTLTPAQLNRLKIIYPGMAKREIADHYRSIRTKLLAFTGGRNSVTLVTSVAPKSGVTHVAINVAAAFAFDRSKTSLLIDANVRSPELHERFLLNPLAGLTDFIDYQVSNLDSIIYPSGIERLRVIPAGSQCDASSELFASFRMKAFVDVLRSRYSDRHIFIDGPAVNQSADTRILAELCDNILLVVPFGQVNDRQVVKALETLPQEKIVGVISNQY